MIFSTYSYSQAKFEINVLNSIDYSFIGKFHRESAFDPNVDYKAPLGVSIGVSVEFKKEESSSFLTGVRYSNKNFYPDLELTFYYGGRLSFGGDTLGVSMPHLTRLQYQTISIPIAHKYYFKRGNKVSFYILGGVNTSFRISKKENFEDIYLLSESEIQANKISAQDRKVKLFSTAIDLGAGMNLKIKEDLDIIFQFNIQMLEYRKADDQLIGIWPANYFGNDNVWWEDRFLPVGQFSFGIGLKKSII